MERPLRRFWIKLAKLWHCTIREAQERCDATEFKTWVAEYGIEPWGDDRGDLHSAVIASVIANANRGKGTRAFKLEDFMPHFGKRQRKTAEQLARTLNAIAAMQHMGAR